MVITVTFNGQCDIKMSFVSSLIGYCVLDNVSFPDTFRVYKASGSLKSFVARHGISGTITSTCCES